MVFEPSGETRKASALDAGDGFMRIPPIVISPSTPS